MKNMNMKQKTAIGLAGLSMAGAALQPFTVRGMEKVAIMKAIERLNTLSESLSNTGGEAQKQKGPGIGTTTITWTDDNGKEVALRIKSDVLEKELGLKSGFTENWIGYRSFVAKLDLFEGKSAIINVYIGPEGVIVAAVPTENPIAANAKVVILPIVPYMDQNNEYRLDIKGQNLVFLGKDLNGYVMNVDQTRVAYTDSRWDAKGDIAVTIDESGKFSLKSQKSELKGMIKVEVPDTVSLIPEGVIDLTDKSLDQTARVGVVTSEKGFQSKNIVVEGGKDANGNAYNYEMSPDQMNKYPKTTSFVKGDLALHLAWDRGYRGIRPTNSRAVVIVPSSKDAVGKVRDAFAMVINYAAKGGMAVLHTVGQYPVFGKLASAVKTDVGIVQGTNANPAESTKHLAIYDAKAKVTITFEEMAKKAVTWIKGIPTGDDVKFDLLRNKKPVASATLNGTSFIYNGSDIMFEIKK